MTAPCSDFAFVERYSSICEGSAWLITRAASRRPFDDLASVLMQVISEATESEQLDLLRGHPELGAIKSAANSLSMDSRDEQMSAGLHKLTATELEKISELNRLYRAQNGFPFILAVRDKNLQQILQTLQQRITNSIEEEKQTALAEVVQIMTLRFEQLKK